MVNNSIQIFYNGGIHYIYPDSSFSESDIQRKIEWIINTFNNVPADIEQVEWIWCLVGNIVEEHVYGENHEIKKGSKHFAPGAKVYCFPPIWLEDYGNIMVIGKPRKQRKLITIVINSNLVTNWRIQQVYDKYVISEMLTNYGWDNSDESKARLEEQYKRIIEKQTQKKQ